MKLFERETNDEYSLYSFGSGKILSIQKVIGDHYETSIELINPEVLFHDNTVSVWGFKRIQINDKYLYESVLLEFYTRKQRKKSERRKE